MFPPHSGAYDMIYSERKHPRLKEYDYSLPGYYYITIHTEADGCTLSRVGRGLAPANAVIHLTEAGKIARHQLLELEERYSHVKIDKYVIMPNHIHVIIRLLEEAAGASPRPTIPDVVCTFKSLTTRAHNQQFDTLGHKLFQTSFYDTVLRNERAYQECWKYIEENPIKWLLRTEESPYKRQEDFL